MLIVLTNFAWKAVLLIFDDIRLNYTAKFWTNKVKQ